MPQRLWRISAEGVKGCAGGTVQGFESRLGRLAAGALNPISLFPAAPAQHNARAPTCELAVRRLVNVELKEAAAERARQRLAPRVRARRVLRREQHEVGVRPHRLLQLRHKQLAVVVEQPGDGGGGGVGWQQ
jgi:hypothetical protein